MLDEVDLDKLFPSATPKSTPDASAPETVLTEGVAEPNAVEDDVARRMFQKDETPAPSSAVPESIKALRDEDVERKLFSAQGTYSDVIPDDMFDQHSVGAMDTPVEVKTGLIREYREIAADVGLSKEDVQLLQQRTLSLRDAPIDDDDQQAGAMLRLVEVFGAEGVREALKEANALLDRDPRTRQLVHGWGLGNDAETIVMLVRAARSERAKGRLK